MVPSTVRVHGGYTLTGSLEVPGDKSISHRALLVAALAEGVSTLRGLSDGDDVRRTRNAIEAIGAAVEPGHPGLRIVGGRDRLHEAAGALDCGNSGTTMRLVAGVVAAMPWKTVLVGDDSLSRRPMDRIAVPLRMMGATVSGQGTRCLPPIEVIGGALRGITWTPPIASAQVKSAILFAGVCADGETVVHEPVPTRTHTEVLLARAGADVVVEGSAQGRTVRIHRSRLRPIDLDVPGDPSQAAFWVVGATVIAGSEVRVARLHSSPERSGFLEVLSRMGARIEVLRTGEADIVDLVARWSRLRATRVEAAEIPSLDEVPALAVAAAVAEGTTIFSDVGELRVKESDRLAATVAMLQAFGARAQAVGDQLVVEGLGPRAALSGACFDSAGDHRLAMAATIAALAAQGTSTITGFGGVMTSYPGFLDDLSRLAGASAFEPVDHGATTADPVDAEIGAADNRARSARQRERQPGRAPLIAIDGPAGAGKSTVSKAVAQRLGLQRLDTGAMYRAVAWAALERGVDPADAEALGALAASVDVVVGARVTVDGVDVTEAIRSPEVNEVVSTIAANPAVRRALVARQRRWAAQHHGGVVEGRDIGTVVFPEADLKVFLTASPQERARRRGDEAPATIARRDHLDATRAASPLRAAPDAHIIDTTSRTVEDVVDEILSWC